VFLVQYDHGVAFPSGELRSFMGFPPRLTELVVVTGLMMLQIQKYRQSFVMSLFAYCGVFTPYKDCNNETRSAIT
jgi:hypothetical protein